MEHFFMYICCDTSIAQEPTVTDYIKNLLPNTESAGCFHTGSLPLRLLECSSAYLAVVSPCRKTELLEWTKIKDFSAINEVISESFKSEDESPKEEIVPLDQILSSHINHLADQLPSLGTYKLDVIISYDVLKDFSISSNIEFAGCLYRLFHWHGAHTVIAAHEEIEQISLKEWCDITNAELLKNEMDLSLGALAWRGSIQFQTSTKKSNSFKEFQLRLDFSENAVLLDNPESKTPDTATKSAEHLILSSCLNVIDECSISSVPPYLMVPIAFRLCAYKSEDNLKLLEYLSNKNEAALIVRMGYSVAEDKPKVDKSLTTNFWQKMMSSGNFKIPEGSLPITDNYISFVITKSNKSNNILAYPMRDPSKINTQFYFTYMNQLNSCSSTHTEKCAVKKKIEMKLPYLSEAALCNLVNQVTIAEENMNKKCDGDHSSESHKCLHSVLESASKNCVYCTIVLGEDTSELLCEEIDPVDWPERVHLLQKQIRLDKEKKSVPPHVLQNLSPQRAQLSVCFPSEDVMKYFEPSGEAKDLTNAELISSLCNGKNTDKQDYNKMLQAEWPDVMKCSYDDIYYNSNTHAEDLEAMGNEMVRFYVQHETSCSCNRDQQRLDAAIPIRTRHRESAQKWRSPVKQRTPRKEKSIKPHKGKAMQGQNGNPGLSKSLSHKSFTDSQSSRLIHRTKSFSSSVEKLFEIEKGRKQLLRQNSIPIRQSPRKKMPVKYSKHSTTASINNNSTARHPKAEKKQSNGKSLPELSIKKLRVAVVLALENNDINSDHAFFRPCFKRLFTICQAFVQDLPCKKGRTSEHMQKIADAHVKQVIEFEKLKDA